MADEETRSIAFHANRDERIHGSKAEAPPLGNVEMNAGVCRGGKETPRCIIIMRIAGLIPVFHQKIQADARFQ